MKLKRVLSIFCFFAIILALTINNVESAQIDENSNNYLKGDINRDGKVDLNDAKEILDKFERNDVKLEDIQNADLNSDGLLTPIDASIIIDMKELENCEIKEYFKSLKMKFEYTAITVARAVYIKDNYLYHTGNSGYSVSKLDISLENTPLQISKVGGHKKVYPRGMAANDKYMYVPYRDNSVATKTSFGDEDIGGYLDIIRLSDFKLVNTITYSRKEYVSNGKKKYFGKSHYSAVYGKYLCVTMQMGGWLLYDISLSGESDSNGNPYGPENPKLIFEYDNRYRIEVDNLNNKGYAEFQKPEFYEANGDIYLAIAGYDRDLLKIYNISKYVSGETSEPYCEYTCNLRQLWNGNLSEKYIHTMGITCKYPYIYCTVASYPSKVKDFDNTMQGCAVVDVNDMNNIKVNLVKIPDKDRSIIDTGEPSPCSISVIDDIMVMDNSEKGVAVFSLKDPSEPYYIGSYSVGNTICNVVINKDKKIFLSSKDGKIYMLGM